MNHCTCTGDPNSVPMLAQVFYLPLLLPVSDSSHSLHREPAVWFLGMQGQCALETQTNIESQCLWLKIRRSCPCNSNVDTGKRDTRSLRKGLKHWHPGKRLC